MSEKRFYVVLKFEKIPDGTVYKSLGIQDEKVEESELIKCLGPYTEDEANQVLINEIIRHNKEGFFSK